MKLKYSIIPKLCRLTAKEMDLLLYMVRIQDQKTGAVEGVYYRNVMEASGMCKQSFYNALRGLEKKGVITSEKETDMDYDIQILGNGFPNEAEWHKGYVKLNRSAFRSKAFKALKAHEKYMLLEFLKGTHENGHSIQIGVDTLYQKFMDILGVSKRVIRGYLHNLKKFFSIGVKDGKYYITYLHSVFRDAYGPDVKSEESIYLEHLVKKECWRKHIAGDEAALEDTAGLVKQYRQRYGRGTEAMIGLLMACVEQSIQGLGRKMRRLQPRYINKLIQEAIRKEEGPM